MQVVFIYRVASIETTVLAIARVTVIDKRGRFIEVTIVTGSIVNSIYFVLS